MPKLFRRFVVVAAVMLTVVGGASLVSSASAQPTAAAVSGTAAGGSRTTAAAFTITWSTKWELYYGSGYGGDRLVWSNRVPTWKVGDASVAMTFKTNCGQAVTVIGKGTTFSTPTSVNTPCNMTYHHGGDIYETQHGGAVIWRTNTYNAGSIYFYTALQLVTRTDTGEHWGCWNVYTWDSSGNRWLRSWMAVDPGGVCENSV